MESPAPKPQPQATIKKWPFIAGYLVLTLAAVGIAGYAVHIGEPLGAWSVAGCLTALFASFACLVFPFVIEFSLQLQAKNQELEEALDAQSAVLEDALGRWNRLHGDVKAIFESSKINVAGYEGLLHRFDQRMETLDARMQEIENVGRIFKTGLKEMGQRAESLHAQEAQAWETRLSEHQAQFNAELTKLREELLEKSEQAPTTGAEAVLSEDALEPLQTSLEAILGRLDTFERLQEPEEAEPWSDPKGKYDSMLARALGENTTKPNLPIPEEPEVAEEVVEETFEEEVELEPVAEEIEIEEEPELIVEDSEEVIEDSEETVEDFQSETYENAPEEVSPLEDPFDDEPAIEGVSEAPVVSPEIDPSTMPILDDDFIDEISEDFQEEALSEEPSAVEDVDWPEPDAEEIEPEIEEISEEPEAVSEEPEVEEDPAEPEPLEAPVIAEQAAEPASITASILIGIGDKIFVRGTGHGLQQDIGTEMEFVNIGSYRWSHDGITTPLTLEFYLNDEIASVEGPITLRPGEHIEISPDFP